MPGTALAVGVLTVTTALAAGLASVGAAAAFGQRLSGAADAAALAAADAASGAVTGEPCARAAELAEADGASLAGCDLAGLIATVTVSASFGPFATSASARAGPPPEAGATGATAARPVPP